MALRQQGAVVATVLAVSLAIGMVAMGGSHLLETHAGSERRLLPPVIGPALQIGDHSEESLQAQASTVDGAGNTFQTEVTVTGHMHGTVVQGVVFRSQESPDMLRLGWESPDHLVISVPQYPQDAGKAVGAGDPQFHCATRSPVVQISCESYPVGPRPQ